MGTTGMHRWEKMMFQGSLQGRRPASKIKIANHENSQKICVHLFLQWFGGISIFIQVLSGEGLI